MPEIDSEFVRTPRGRMLQRLLVLLNKDVKTAGLRLLAGDGRVLLALGGLTHEGETTTIELGEYELLLGKAPGSITTAERAALRALRRIVEDLLSRIAKHESGQLGAISFSNLVAGYLENLKLLESRSTLLQNYEHIIRLNDQILMAQDLQAVLQIIMDMAAQAIGGSGSSLLLVDSRTGEMYFNVVSGDKGTELQEIRIPAGQGIAGSVVQSGRPELIPDVGRDPRTFQKVDKVLEQTTRDMVVVPIVARGQIIGVIEVINSIAEIGFTEEDLEFLSNIASHTSLLIENARGKEDLVKTNQELDRRVAETNALYEVGKVLNSTLAPDELKQGFLRGLMKLLRIRHGSIIDYREESRELVHEAGLRISEKQSFEKTEETPVYEGTHDIILWMKQNREPFFFGEGDESAGGLAKRFRKDNPTLFGGSDRPAVWIPVGLSDSSGEIDFIISLGEAGYRKGDSAGSLNFFRGVMNQADAAFRNVKTHADALDSREKEQHIRQVFQKYVPARVVGEVLEQKETPGPRAQEATVLFADIRGFTRLAEVIEPALLVQLINEFYEAMVPIVDKHGGIIDKFMGDSLMAVFGVPRPDPADASNALNAAREMQDRLDQLNRERSRENRPAFAMGIGMHSGHVIAGNIGASRRLDYTVIGDTVNLAARLEKVAKDYRSGILFSEDTLLRAGTKWPVREADLLMARGRIESTRVYELIQRDENRMNEIMPRWNEALRKYRGRDFADALNEFQAIKSALGHDSLSDIYIKRCAEYISAPPPKDWDGVYRVTV